MSIRFTGWVAGLCVLGAAGVAAAAVVATGSSTTTIYACQRDSSGGEDGFVRIVADPSRCRKNEQVISWNVQGPKGETGAAGPAGATGPAGPPGPGDNMGDHLARADVDLDGHDLVGGKDVKASAFKDAEDEDYLVDPEASSYLKNVNVYGNEEHWGQEYHDGYERHYGIELHDGAYETHYGDVYLEGDENHRGTERHWRDVHFFGPVDLTLTWPAFVEKEGLANQNTLAESVCPEHFKLISGGAYCVNGALRGSMPYTVNGWQASCTESGTVQFSALCIRSEYDP